MEKQGFVKSSKLSGYQKAAILLAEIGPARNSNYAALLEALDLSPKETKKLRLAMKSLQPYLQTEPKNIGEIYREQNILQTCLNYGQMKGIYNPEEHVDNTPAYIKNDKTGVGKMLAQNPEAVARILGNWLDN